MNSAILKEQARAAYERGRFLSALKLLFVVAPIITLACFTCGADFYPVVLGIVLAILVIGLKWRGEEYGFAVGPGLFAGAVAFIIPITMHILGICCRNNLEIIFCGASGMIGGLVLGQWIGKSRRQHKIKSFVLALLVAGLTAGLGCASLEIGAVIGLLGALTLAALSTYAVTKKKAAQ